MLFWALAPFYRALGANGVLVGVALINLASAIGFVLVAWRRGGRLGALLGGLVVALVVRELGPDLLVDPWNPSVAFLPFLLFLGLVWSVLCGETRSLPLAVLVGSFVIQSHFGYLPLVGTLLLVSATVAVVELVQHRRRLSEESSGAPRSVPWRSPLAWAGVIAAACWAPVIVQQLIGSPGNLSALVTYVRNPPEPAVGWTIAFGTMGQELRPLGPWLAGGETTIFGLVRTGSTIWAIVTIGSVAIAGWWATKRGEKDAGRLAVVALVAIGVSLVATARVTGLFASYVLRWWHGVAAVAYLSIAWSVLCGLGRRRWVTATAETAALVGLIAVVVLQLVALPIALPVPSVSKAIGPLAQPTAAALDGEKRYLVRAVDDRSLAAPASGMILALTTRGYRVFGEWSRNAVLTYGSRRVARPDQVDGIVTVVEISEFDAGWQVPAGGRVVATFDPLTRRQRDRFRSLDARIRRALGPKAQGRLPVDSPYQRYVLVADGAHQRDVDDLARLQAIGDGYVVVLSPAEDG
jgi:hypothetical protein